ncbi:MAG TPA: hypothetical protein PLA68_05585 [Panacibacter sp.]|nr:hypothetical protein [Panacibacter sp.]
MNWKKIFRIILIFFVLGLSVAFYFRYYWVFATGTRAGVLNTFMKKGVMFKTWEGKIIQSGFKANIQSNEFEFSVENERVAELLNNNPGTEVQVQYREYLGALPWRGMQVYVVDSVYQIKGVMSDPGVKPTIQGQ